MRNTRLEKSDVTRSQQGRKSSSISLRLLLLVALTLLSFIVCAHNTTHLQDQADISSLTIGYAQGTDEIGNGNLAAGKALYAKCFTDDAQFEGLFPNGDLQKSASPNAWADFVATAFEGAGYTTTQHLVGTIDVSVEGDTATMTSEVHATHVLPDGGMDVANGKYTDTVVMTSNGWRISKRKLKLITFINIPAGKPKVGGD
jgi:ketosteroid isomerase-like protein